jgi:hypothetical protein
MAADDKDHGFLSRPALKEQRQNQRQISRRTGGLIEIFDAFEQCRAKRVPLHEEGSLTPSPRRPVLHPKGVGEAGGMPFAFDLSGKASLLRRLCRWIS